VQLEIASGGEGRGKLRLPYRKDLDGEQRRGTRKAAQGYGFLFSVHGGDPVILKRRYSHPNLPHTAGRASSGTQTSAPRRRCGPWPIAILLCALLCTSSDAQIRRLPPVELGDTNPIRLASHPGSASRVLLAPGEVDPAIQPPVAEEASPPGARSGMFQKAIFTGGWLAGGSAGGLGVTTMQLEAVLALPCPTRESPLIITPGYQVYYLDGPTGVDLPPQLHEGYCQFRWMSKVTPAWALDFAVTPGWYSDYEQSSDKALRITGHGAVALTTSPTTTWILGASYLDREDISVLPLGGLIWTPNDDYKYEFTFPRPRLARRVYWSGACTPDVQDWIYVGGELGGGTWAIARASGLDDVVNYRDYRIFLGGERKMAGGLNTRLEVGYVFGRKIEYNSATPDFEPNDSVMVRGGLTY